MEVRCRAKEGGGERMEGRKGRKWSMHWGEDRSEGEGGRWTGRRGGTRDSWQGSAGFSVPGFRVAHEAWGEGRWVPSTSKIRREKTCLEARVEQTHKGAHPGHHTPTRPEGLRTPWPSHSRDHTPKRLLRLGRKDGGGGAHPPPSESGRVVEAPPPWREARGIS